MMLIGLAGSAGVGKDTVADYLVEQYGFTKFSFSDMLYREVSDAFGVPISELQDRDRKEKTHHLLRAANCSDTNFAGIMARAVKSSSLDDMRFGMFSPRWVLQRWGTEYRREQDQNYWLKKADLWLEAWSYISAENGTQNPCLVNSSVRFPNEQEWIHKHGGAVWYVHRAATTTVASELDYVSELPLASAPGDRSLNNFGTVEQLHTLTSLLLQATDSSDDDRIELYPDTPVESGKLVACIDCGEVHVSVTRGSAEFQVSMYNNWFDAQTTETQEIYGNKHAVVEDYTGCIKCGCERFAELLPPPGKDTEKLIGVPPVIYEESN